MPNKHKHLVLCPAGLGVYSYAGFFNANPHLLEDVETLVGSSAGALYGLFPALGFSPAQTLEILLSVNLKELLKPSAVSFVRKYGLYNYGTIREKFVELCGGDPLFEDLKVNLVVGAYCINTYSTRYFSKERTPRVKVLDAVLASCALPFLLEPVDIDGMFYIDGGFCDAWPADPVMSLNPEEVLKVNVKFEISHKWVEKIPNIVDYINIIVSGCVKNRTNYKYPCPVIQIGLPGDLDAFNFATEYDDMLKLVVEGQNTSYFLGE